MYCHDLEREISMGVCHEEACPHRAYCQLYLGGGDHITREAVPVDTWGNAYCRVMRKISYHALVTPTKVGIQLDPQSRLLVFLYVLHAFRREGLRVFAPSREAEIMGHAKTRRVVTRR